MKKSVKLLILCLLLVLTVVLGACTKSYFVTFTPQNGEPSSTVKFRENFQVPTPTNGSLIFGGWYLDEDCTDGKEWKVPQKLAKNITVYAKWTDANGNKPAPAPDPTPTQHPAFDSFGMPTITVYISDYNVTEDGIYNSMEEVSIYIYLFGKLPSNYNSDSSYVRKNYTTENKLCYTGGKFNNREGLLPNASGRTFVELDIAYKGGGRNALRIVYSSDGHIFYTTDHYASFSAVRVLQSH